MIAIEVSSYFNDHSGGEYWKTQIYFHEEWLYLSICLIKQIRLSKHHEKTRLDHLLT